MLGLAFAPGCGSLLAFQTARLFGPQRDAALGGDPDTSFDFNGCGPSGPLDFAVPECPFGLICFTPACNEHDICYQTAGITREQCDDAFGDNLRALCSEQYAPGDPLLITCESLAYIYWQAVARFGGAFFEPSPLDAAPQPLARTLPPARNLESPAVAPFEDADDDLLPDAWERLVGLNPADYTDALADYDLDGLNNLQEFLYAGDPFEPEEVGPP